MRTLKIAAMAMFVMMTAGCAGCQKDFRHFQSSMTGLQRHVTLYAENGRIIREWDTKSVMECGASMCSWIDDRTDKEFKISGTFIIEEVR